MLVAYPIGKNELDICDGEISVGKVRLANKRGLWQRREVWNWQITSSKDSPCSGSAQSEGEALVRFRDAWTIRT